MNVILYLQEHFWFYVQAMTIIAINIISRHGHWSLGQEFMTILCVIGIITLVEFIVKFMK